MKITLENLPGLERKLDVTIPSERIENEVSKKLKEMAARAKLPGFRPGKAPFEIIKKNYGKSAYSEVIDNLVRETYPEAIQKESLQPVGPPAIKIVSADPDGHFVYTATFEVYPEIKLVGFDTMEVERLGAEVKESDIDEMLEKMRKSHVEWEEITDSDRKSSEGDQLTVDFAIKPQDSEEEPKIEKGVKFALGDGFMWKEFEEPLLGIGVGEEKSYTLDMPDTHMDKNLAGKKVDFKVNVEKLCSPILPELDDDFALKMSIKEGGIAKLKEEVKNQMERELDNVLKGLFKKTVMENLLDSNLIDVPKVLVEQELGRLSEAWNKRFAEQRGGMPGEKPEFPRDEYETQARRNVALGLLLSAIVKEHNLTVAQDEVRKKIEDMLSSYNDESGEMIQKCLSDQRYMREIESLLLEEKVVEYLVSQIKVIEKDISYKEAMEQK